MPRKKQTRAKPKITENEDPDKSLTADSSNDAALRKEAFMRDFRIQVKERLDAMEQQKKAAKKDISRLLLSEKMKLKKEIRQMTVKDFIVKGGDLRTFDFTMVSEAAVCDVSFLGESSASCNDTVVKAPITKHASSVRSTRKRGAVIAESPLIHDAPVLRSTRSTRSRRFVNAASSMMTPSVPRGSYYSGLPMRTPLITPKFDPRQPLTAAREPKNGETLMSLAGSPVIQNQTDEDGSSNLLSLRLDKHQTLLGGLLFDETMSPRTLNTNKERLQEAIGAIESRLGELSTQFSGQFSGLQVSNENTS